jgi:hypothetical protein
MPTEAELTAELEGERTKYAGAQARITALNHESQGHRLNWQTAKDAEAKARTDLEAAATAHGVTLAAAEKKATDAAAASAEVTKNAAQRAVNADLRVAANTAGANDVADVLALLPRDKIKLNPEGDITNAAELMTELKTAKPYLFGAPSTSSTAKVPPDKDAPAKQARDMTADEYKAARAAITKR